MRLLVRTTAPLSKAHPAAMVLPRLPDKAEATWTEDGLRASFYRSANGIGWVTVELPTGPAWHEACLNELEARRMVKAAVPLLKAGRTPRNGVTRALAKGGRVTDLAKAVASAEGPSGPGLGTRVVRAVVGLDRPTTLARHNAIRDDHHEAAAKSLRAGTPEGARAAVANHAAASAHRAIGAMLERGSRPSRQQVDEAHALSRTAHQATHAAGIHHTWTEPEAVISRSSHAADMRARNRHHVDRAIHHDRLAQTVGNVHLAKLHMGAADAHRAAAAATGTVGRALGQGHGTDDHVAHAANISRRADRLSGRLRGLDKAKRGPLIRRALRGVHPLRKGGPYIGPRGGQWADIAHTIPWHDTPAHHAYQHHMAESERHATLGEQATDAGRHAEAKEHFDRSDHHFTEAHYIAATQLHPPEDVDDDPEAEVAHDEADLDEDLEKAVDESAHHHVAGWLRDNGFPDMHDAIHEYHATGGAGWRSHTEFRHALHQDVGWHYGHVGEPETRHIYDEAKRRIAGMRFPSEMKKAALAKARRSAATKLPGDVEKVDKRRRKYWGPPDKPKGGKRARQAPASDTPNRPHAIVYARVQHDNAREDGLQIGGIVPSVGVGLWRAAGDPREGPEALRNVGERGTHRVFSVPHPRANPSEDEVGGHLRKVRALAKWTLLHDHASKHGGGPMFQDRQYWADQDAQRRLGRGKRTRASAKRDQQRAHHIAKALYHSHQSGHLRELGMEELAEKHHEATLAHHEAAATVYDASRAPEATRKADAMGASADAASAFRGVPRLGDHEITGVDDADSNPTTHKRTRKPKAAGPADPMDRDLAAWRRHRAGHLNTAHLTPKQANDELDTIDRLTKHHNRKMIADGFGHVTNVELATHHHPSAKVLDELRERGAALNRELEHRQGTKYGSRFGREDRARRRPSKLEAQVGISEVRGYDPMHKATRLLVRLSKARYQPVQIGRRWVQFDDDLGGSKTVERPKRVRSAPSPPVPGAKSRKRREPELEPETVAPQTSMGWRPEPPPKGEPTVQRAYHLPMLHDLHDHHREMEADAARRAHRAWNASDRAAWHQHAARHAEARHHVGRAIAALQTGRGDRKALAAAYRASNDAKAWDPRGRTKGVGTRAREVVEGVGRRAGRMMGMRMGARLLVKAKKLPIGHVSHRKDGPFIKVADTGKPTDWKPAREVDGKWEAVPEGTKKRGGRKAKAATPAVPPPERDDTLLWYKDTDGVKAGAVHKHGSKWVVIISAKRATSRRLTAQDEDMGWGQEGGRLTQQRVRLRDALPHEVAAEEKRRADVKAAAAAAHPDGQFQAWAAAHPEASPYPEHMTPPGVKWTGVARQSGVAFDTGEGPDGSQWARRVASSYDNHRVSYLRTPADPERVAAIEQQRDHARSILDRIAKTGTYTDADVPHLTEELRQELWNNRWEHESPERLRLDADQKPIVTADGHRAETLGHVLEAHRIFGPIDGPRDLAFERKYQDAMSGADHGFTVERLVPALEQLRAADPPPGYGPVVQARITKAESAMAAAKAKAEADENAATEAKAARAAARTSRPSSRSPVGRGPSASFTKLRDGSWGIRVEGDVDEGDSVTVRRKDGSKETKRLGRLVHDGGSFKLFRLTKAVRLVLRQAMARPIGGSRGGGGSTR